MIIYYSHFLCQKYIFIASNLSPGINRLEHAALCKVTSRHGEQIKKMKEKIIIYLLITTVQDILLCRFEGKTDPSVVVQQIKGDWGIELKSPPPRWK